MYICLFSNTKKYMVQVNVGKKKRSGKNGSTPGENNHPDRESTAPAVMMCTDEQEFLPTLLV